MKTLIIIIIEILLICPLSFGNSIENDLVTLSKVYNQFHAFTDINSATIEDLKKFQNTELELISKFIIEISLPNNNIMSKDFLTKPDSSSLRYFHIIVLLNYNMFNPNGRDNYELAKELLIKKLNKYESLRFYYSSLFSSVLNKNKSLSYSNLDINLDSIHLCNDTEKGIFMLEFAKSYGSQAVSYIKYAKKPRYDAAYKYIQSFPTINSLPYYKYTYFGFPDLKMLLNREEQNFKEYYLNYYYELLIAHCITLIKLKKDETEIKDLLLSSLLCNQQYYQYSKDKDFLEDLFKKVN